MDQRLKRFTWVLGLVLGGTLASGCPIYLEDFESRWDDCEEDDEDCDPNPFCDSHPDSRPDSPDAGDDGSAGQGDGGAASDGDSGPDCAKNADCGDGSCHAGHCIDAPPAPCSAHADCGTGFSCKKRQCEPADLCDGDADCGSHSCDARQTCVGPERGTCDTDSACDGGQCIANQCVDNGEDICQFHHDCGPGRGCVDRACTPLCTKNSDCPTSMGCSAGLCAPTTGDECAFSSECDGGSCIGGHCVASCERNADCAPDTEVCGAAGRCVPDIAPRPFCSDDAGCNAGHLCVDGVCRSPCPSGDHEECLRFDSQVPVCADDGLCYSTQETAPDCARSRECGAGQSCMDGLCRN